MTDPVDRIGDDCWVSVRMGLRITSRLTTHLPLLDGFYDLRGAKTLHPLETCLRGVEGCTGDFRSDVARELGVEGVWVEGFIAGFAREPEQSANPAYEEGYLAGGSLRTHRFPQANLP